MIWFWIFDLWYEIYCYVSPTYWIFDLWYEIYCYVSPTYWIFDLWYEIYCYVSPTYWIFDLWIQKISYPNFGLRNSGKKFICIMCTDFLDFVATKSNFISSYWLQIRIYIVFIISSKTKLTWYSEQTHGHVQAKIQQACIAN